MRNNSFCSLWDLNKMQTWKTVPDRSMRLNLQRYSEHNIDFTLKKQETSKNHKKIKNTFVYRK